MSTIEERLIQDIEAVTGGISMTESDLREARGAVERRIEDRQQRNRRRGVVAAAAAAAVVLGVATWQALGPDDADPTPSEPAPSPSPSLSSEDRTFLSGVAPTADDLRGVWRLDNPTESRMLFRFGADGSFSYDDLGLLSADPLVLGSFDVDGDTISVDVQDGTAQCAGETLTLRAVVASGGALHVLPADEPGSPGCERPFRSQWVLERVLPTPEGAAYQAPPGRNWDPLTDPDVVAGVWWDTVGDYLVELRADATYSILTGAGDVADTGTWAMVATASRLDLVSGADSPTCNPGDQFTLGNLRTRDLGTLVIQGDAGRNDCDLPWRDAGWFKLAP